MGVLCKLVRWSRIQPVGNEMTERRKRFLVICEGGVVRSASLATVLRWDFQQDAVPLSGAKSGQEAIDLLSEWSEYIVVMWNPAVDRIEKKYAHKIRIFDIGPDVWGNPMDPKLRQIVGEAAEKWQRNGWVL